jgi:hypothetical protein
VQQFGIYNTLYKKHKAMPKMKETPSRTSPKSSKRGCLCKNGTYSTKCCKGNMINQGIGSITKISE